MEGVESFRAKLGLRLVFWSTLALVGLGIVVMIGATVAEIKGNNGAVQGAAQLLFSSLLPLFGTWVGTILAFYYTKENYEAASRGTLDVVRSVAQRLSATPIAGKMMPKADIVSISLGAGQSIDDVPISKVEDGFAKTKDGQRISRLLFLDSNGACVAILHRSVYNEMLATGLRQSPPMDVSKDGMGKLLAMAHPTRAGKTYKDFVQNTLAYIAQDRTLADAKLAMEQVPGCQDVIVTQNGIKSEPLLGWISNIDIGRFSQA